MVKIFFVDRVVWETTRTKKVCEYVKVDAWDFILFLFYFILNFEC